ncbi:MAG: 4'-phosphopantetheinyl transferase superfamily protein [Clostridia bacterium]|nr:4'-phosphopantetheinyl transferase superfamily protein [Clostridia bacterium]
MDTVSIYFADIDALREVTLYDSCYATLPLSVQNHIDTIKNIDKKRQSVAAYFLLYYGLKKLGNNSKHELIFSDTGKPQFETVGLPYFSLSHSNQFAMCAFANQEIGCDIQFCRSYNGLLYKRALSSIEQNALKQFDDLELRAHVFNILWVLKESVIKAAGQNLHPNLDKLSVIDFEGDLLSQISYNNKSYSLEPINLENYRQFKQYSAAFSICTSVSHKVNSYYNHKIEIVDIGEAL